MSSGVNASRVRLLSNGVEDPVGKGKRLCGGECSVSCDDIKCVSWARGEGPEEVCVWVVGSEVRLRSKEVV